MAAGLERSNGFRKRGFFAALLACWLVPMLVPTSVAAPQGGGSESAEKLRLGAHPAPLGDYGWEVAFPELRFRRPLHVTAHGDGSDRLVVVEQAGKVHVFENRGDVRGTDVALDLSGVVYRRHNEEGLLGLAFHPDFASNRRVFLHYSASRPRRNVLSRFQMDRAGRRIDPRSEQVLLQVRQPYGNHNGGHIAFGPDGYLYVTLGDGGAANDPHGNGQDLGTLLGTILRIDVDRPKGYSIPADNPFVGRAGARGEIWAWGLRNVWRFSFDRVTGALWAGDVGQNRWEEIDVITRGGNYGWNLREGKHPFRRGRAPGELIEPVIDYSRGEGVSVTGGHVYRGRKLPGLVGAYLYADFQSGAIWALRWDGKEVIENRLLGHGPNVSGFGEDRHGEVYFCGFDGRIYRFVRRAPAVAGQLPRRLSETGIFTDMRDMTPHPRLIPYSINVPLWSDEASKQRYLILPEGKQIGVRKDGSYAFPVGSVLVKTFSFDPKRGDARSRGRLETRLLIHSQQGWSGYTYAWDQEQEEAWIVESRSELPLVLRGPGGRRQDRRWMFPSPSDCMQCHTSAAGFVLGFRSEQLDLVQRVPDAVPENQLVRLVRRQVFADVPDPRPSAWPAWDEEHESSALQVRAYLDANCAMCHQPEGPGNSRIDLRFTTPLEASGMLNVSPGQGDLGVRGAKLLVPGSPRRSLLLIRMQRFDERGMPPLSHQLPDDLAIERISRWIQGLK